MPLLDNLSPATVRHITRDHVHITPAKGFSVTVFSIAAAHVEAIVVSDDGFETIRLLIEAPGPTRTMTISKHEISGDVDIIYSEKDHE